jgi:hypothetical protein
MVSFHMNDPAATPTPSATGWTVINTARSASSNAHVIVVEKDSVAGDEGATTEDFTLSTAARGVAIAWAVDGAHPIDVFFGTPAQSAGNANPDPPSVSLGAEGDGLWVALFAARDDDATVTVEPADYTHATNWGISGGGTNAGCTGGMAARQLTTTTSDNPGPWTLSEGEEWVAQAMAIPAAEDDGSDFSSISDIGFDHDDDHVEIIDPDLGDTPTPFPQGRLGLYIEAAFGAGASSPLSWVWTDLSERLRGIFWSCPMRLVRRSGSSKAKARGSIR